VATSFLNGYVGFYWGIVEAIATGNPQAILGDNQFNKWMHEFDEYVRTDLAPIRETRAYQNAKWWEKPFMDPTGWYGTTVLSNLGFTQGSILAAVTPGGLGWLGRGLSALGKVGKAGRALSAARTGGTAAAKASLISSNIVDATGKAVTYLGSALGEAAFETQAAIDDYDKTISQKIDAHFEEQEAALAQKYQNIANTQGYSNELEYQYETERQQLIA